MIVSFHITCANEGPACQLVQDLTPPNAELSTNTSPYSDYDHAFTIDANEEEILEIEKTLKEEAGNNLVDVKIITA